MSKKLTDELRDVVIGKVSSGWSLQRCADWIKRTHRITITKQSLGELVRRHRTTLADVTKGVARQAIAPTIESGVQALQARLEAAQSIVAMCEVEARTNLMRVEQYAKAVGAWAKVQDLWQRAAGLDQQDEPMLDGLAGLMNLAIVEREAAADEAIERIRSGTDAAPSTSDPTPTEH